MKGTKWQFILFRMLTEGGEQGNEGEKRMHMQVDTEEAEKYIKKCSIQKWEEKMGKLYGIGVGPGDPELITLKGLRILREADVIFCPEKAEGAGSFAFEIIKEHLEGNEQEIVNLVYPMHYRGGHLQEMWKKNADRIAGYLEGEKTGVFLTLGDPSVYSTFMYTLPYMKAAGIDTDIIPGITSFCAAAASARTPLVSWNESLVIMPVRKNSSDSLTKIIEENDNVVLMKPSADREALLQTLRDNSEDSCFYLVSRAGTDQESVVNNPVDLSGTDIPYLSTVIVKKRKNLDNY